jgi:flavin-dependent dehydrogenase
MPDSAFDVIVIGAGPAGSTIAILLAQKKRRVALIDAATFPRNHVTAGWLNVRVAPLLGKLGVPVRSLLNRAFREVIFYNADFTKSAKPNFSESAGYLVDRTQFGDALVKSAVEHDVTLFQGSSVASVKLKEGSALATLENGQEVRGRLLVMATGRGSTLMTQLGFAPPTRHGTIWTAQVDGPAGSSSDKSAPHVGVVLGLDRLGSFALCCVSRDGQSVSVNWLGDRAGAIPALMKVCKGLHGHKVTAHDLSAAAEAAVPVPSPASAALDMDTHVGKHTLLIGDAGGFVSAASNEGIYPAMWSAQIAADVVDTALSVPQSQDELMTFETKWRTTMADYLRSPNTDIQFLLPLIFSNQPMADRMGAAFFSGENI